jgi:hypothetical protein
MLLIYTPVLTSRLQYIFSLMFNDLLKLEIELTIDKEYFIRYEGAKMSYSEDAIGDEINFKPAQLLFEKGIKEQDIKVINSENTKAIIFNEKSYLVINNHSNPRSNFPFDPFAASFYLVSRYEEYLPHQKDEHGRFEANQSLAYRNDFLTKPLVNIWAEKIKELLLNKYPDLKFVERKYEYISTIDIDNAYAYKGKGFVRITGALAKSLLKLDFKGFYNRFKVVFMNSHDPFDTYQKLKELNEKYAAKSIYFFLVGDFSEHDRNLSIKQKKYQQLIKSIADYSEVGIHPSYASNANLKLVAKEIKNLNEVLNKEVTKSRQHFLKLRFPDTFRNLIECDIQEDYSMGYAEQVGFRASICSQFYFYDLIKDEMTNLRLYPFAVMDATLNNYMKIKPENVMKYVLPLIQESKVVNGTFISLWHNESLSNVWEWKDWEAVYEQVVKAASK